MKHLHPDSESVIMSEDLHFHDMELDSDPQLIFKIEKATDFLLLKDGVFAAEPQYSLFGMKFATVFALGAGELRYRYSNADYIVVENKITKEVVKFINSKSIAEVIKNVV